MVLRVWNLNVKMPLGWFLAKMSERAKNREKIGDKFVKCWPSLGGGGTESRFGLYKMLLKAED